MLATFTESPLIGMSCLSEPLYYLSCAVPCIYIPCIYLAYTLHKPCIYPAYIFIFILMFIYFPIICRCSSCHEDSSRARSLLILPSVGSGRIYGEQRLDMACLCSLSHTCKITAVTFHFCNCKQLCGPAVFCLCLCRLLLSSLAARHVAWHESHTCIHI